MTLHFPVRSFTTLSAFPFYVLESLPGAPGRRGSPIASAPGEFGGCCRTSGAAIGRRRDCTGHAQVELAVKKHGRVLKT